MMKSKKVFDSEMAPVRRALEAWRKNRPARQPIPEALWIQMADLGHTHGVSLVARALRVDYYTLKRRVRERMPAPDFVEVTMAPADDPRRGCTAELEDRRGRKLLLRWSSAPGSELLGVVQAFLNQGA
jgi:hypothetical protein